MSPYMKKKCIKNEKSVYSHLQTNIGFNNTFKEYQRVNNIV